MGNSLTSNEFDLSDENVSNDDVFQYAEIPDSLVRQLTEEDISAAIGGILGRIAARSSVSSRSNEMPVIRKRPDISSFCHTRLYKEIKALCAYPTSSHLPCEKWSLTRGLLMRENGMVSRTMGAFSPNQQRRIRTLFVPNNKDERLMSLESKVFICKFNKTGNRLITASQDTIVRIYDSSKGTYNLLHRMRAPDINWSILDMDFSPCGKFFAYSTWADFFFVVPMTGCVDKTKWYELNTGQGRNAVFSIRYSPCGSSLIGGCNYSSVFISDVETQAVRCIRTKAGHSVDINAVSFVTDRDPHMIVSGCNSGTVKLWDIRCAGSNNDRHAQNRRCSQPVGVFLGHLDGITFIDPRNDGNYVLTNSKDQSIKIWDLRMPTPSSKLTRYSNKPAIDWDYRWDMVPQEYYNPRNPLDGDVSVMTYRGHRVTKSLLRARFSPREQTGQRYIYTGCGTGRIVIYDVLTGSIKEAIPGHKDIVRDLEWHPVRSEIVSSSWDYHVNLNTFKPNPLLRRSSSDASSSRTNRRRSVRIEHQNNPNANEVETDRPNEPW